METHNWDVSPKYSSGIVSSSAQYEYFWAQSLRRGHWTHPSPSDSSPTKLRLSSCYRLTCLDSKRSFRLIFFSSTGSLFFFFFLFCSPVVFFLPPPLSLSLQLLLERRESRIAWRRCLLFEVSPSCMLGTAAALWQFFFTEGVWIYLQKIWLHHHLRRQKVLLNLWILFVKWIIAYVGQYNNNKNIFQQKYFHFYVSVAYICKS